MQLHISKEEVFEIVKQKVTDGSSVIKENDIETIKFNYDNIREEVMGITVTLKSNVY